MTFLSSSLSLFTFIRGFLLTLSKITFVLLSCYYLFNSKLYSITFMVPQVLRSIPYLSTPLILLEKIGTIIIIVPLTIVVLSFFFEESRFLKITSAFFALSGNIFTLFHSISQGLLEERFKVGFINIFHEVSFENKVKAFQMALNDNAHIYINKVNNFQDFNKYIEISLAQNWTNYSSILQGMKIEQVASYANSTMLNIYNLYVDHLLKLNTNITTAISNNNSNTLKYVIITAVFALAIAFVIYKIRELAFITKDTAETGAKLGEIQGKSLNLQKEQDHDIKSNSTSLDDFSGTVETLHTRAQQCEQVINQHADEITNLQKAISTLEEKLTSNASHINISGDVSNALNWSEFNTLKTSVLSIAKKSQHGFSDMHDNINSLQSRINALDAKVDNVIATMSMSPSSAVIRPNNTEILEAANVREITNAADSAKKAVTEITGLKNDMKNFKLDQSSKVTSLEEKVAAVETIGKKFTTKMNLQDKNSQAIGEATEKLRHHDDSITNLNSTLNNTQSEMNTIKTDLYNKIIQLKEDHTTFANDIKNNLDNLRMTITELPSKIHEIIASKGPETSKPNYLRGTLAFLRGVHQDNANISKGTYTTPISNNNNSLVNTTQSTSTSNVNPPSVFGASTTEILTLLNKPNYNSDVESNLSDQSSSGSMNEDGIEISYTDNPWRSKSGQI